MKRYSENLKRSLAAKLLAPGGKSALSLSKETGISQTTLSKWARIYKSYRSEILEQLPQSPKNWSLKDRFEALIKAATLKGEALGVFLRSKGLRSEHLEKWKKDFISGEEMTRVGRKPKSSEVKKLEQENKELKHDVRKKDKALAEASALLILKKKAQMIWGDNEDEE